MSANITAEIIDNDVVFYLAEGKPMGSPDKCRTEIVSRNPEVKIPPIPTRPPCHYGATRMYWIPQRHEWIGFNFTSYPDRDVGPSEENIYGPYSIADEPPPTMKETTQALHSHDFIQRSHRYYQ